MQNETGSKHVVKSQNKNNTLDYDLYLSTTEILVQSLQRLRTLVKTYRLQK